MEEKEELMPGHYDSKMNEKIPPIVRMFGQFLSDNTCPECGSGLNRQSGCAVCLNCGWSACE